MEIKNFVINFLDLEANDKNEGRYSYEIEEKIYLDDIPEGFNYKIINEADGIDSGIVEIFFNDRRVSEVFSINSANIPTYVKRKWKNYDTYDASLHLALEDPGQTVVLYGPSKLGKSALWRNLLSTNVILIQCNQFQTLEDIYKSIYDEIQNPQPSQITERQENYIDKSFGSVINSIPLSIDFKKNKGHKKTTEKQLTYGNLKMSAQLISKLAYEKNAPIIFENYHRLNDKTFNELCVDIRTISDTRVTTLFVGIPQNPFLFTEINPELEGRIMFMEFLPWKEYELQQIAKSGQEILNIIFDNKTLEFLSKESLGSPLLMQLFSLITCISSGIAARSRDNIEISITRERFKTAIKNYGIQYLAFCKNVLDDFNSISKKVKEMPTNFSKQIYNYINSDEFNLFIDLNKIFNDSITILDIKKLIKKLNKNARTIDFLIIDEKNQLRFGNPLAIVYARWND